MTPVDRPGCRYLTPCQPAASGDNGSFRTSAIIHHANVDRVIVASRVAFSAFVHLCVCSAHTAQALPQSGAFSEREWKLESIIATPKQIPRCATRSFARQNSKSTVSPLPLFLMSALSLVCREAVCGAPWVDVCVATTTESVSPTCTNSRTSRRHFTPIPRGGRGRAGAQEMCQLYGSLGSVSQSVSQSAWRSGSRLGATSHSSGNISV